MKIILFRLLPVSLLVFGLNSCVVAPGPAYVRTPGVSVGVDGGGYADEEDGPAEMGYWGPSGEYSVVFVPGWTRDYVYYDAYGHRDRHGRYNRHGHESHHRSGGESRSRSTYSKGDTSHKGSHSTQSTTRHNNQPSGGSSFKAAQKAAPAALGQKKAPAPVKKKKDEH